MRKCHTHACWFCCLTPGGIPSVSTAATPRHELAPRHATVAPATPRHIVEATSHACHCHRHAHSEWGSPACPSGVWGCRPLTRLAQVWVGWGGGLSGVQSPLPGRPGVGNGLSLGANKACLGSGWGRFWPVPVPALPGVAHHWEHWARFSTRNACLWVVACLACFVLFLFCSRMEQPSPNSLPACLGRSQPKNSSVWETPAWEAHPGLARHTSSSRSHAHLQPVSIFLPPSPSRPSLFTCLGIYHLVCPVCLGMEVHLSCFTLVCRLSRHCFESPCPEPV